MITEDYVSFETAKLLKEKGFDVPITSVWIDHFKLVGCPASISIYPNENNWNGTTGSLKDIYFSAPTLQMAMKWFREVHKLGVFPSTYTTIKGNDVIHTYGTAIVNLNTYELMTLDSMNRETYEDACEAAIKYCLKNLI